MAQLDGPLQYDLPWILQKLFSFARCSHDLPLDQAATVPVWVLSLTSSPTNLPPSLPQLKQTSSPTAHNRPALHAPPTLLPSNHFPHFQHHHPPPPIPLLHRSQPASHHQDTNPTTSSPWAVLSLPPGLLLPPLHILLLAFQCYSTQPKYEKGK